MQATTENRLNAPLVETPAWKALRARYEKVRKLHLRQLFASEGTPEWLVPHRVFEGNSPSSTIILERLTLAALGKLIALYEHAVFIQGAIWDIESFDQWGVELGKVLAQRIIPEVESKTESKLQHDSSTNALINYYRKLKESV